MKNLSYKSWVSAIFICIFCLSFSTQATDNKEEATSAFNCMDKKSFEINDECMSNKIASHDSFEEQQKQIANSTSMVNDMAMATMIFDNRNMTIRIIAHKDAVFAKVDSKEIK